MERKRGERSGDIGTKGETETAGRNKREEKKKEREEGGGGGARETKWVTGMRTDLEDLGMSVSGQRETRSTSLELRRTLHDRT